MLTICTLQFIRNIQRGFSNLFKQTPLTKASLVFILSLSVKNWDS